MSFEILFKRYFGVVVAACVALAAYLQAAGISYLLSAALVSDAPPPLPALPPLPEIVVPHFTAMPIIDRNPFDSVTGPLHDKPEDELLEEEKKPLEITDPLSAPACAGIQVFIVTESSDPLWSFAAVQGPGETGPSLRRVGDAVGTGKVAYIGYNPRSLHPTLWLEGDSLCQASMFGDPEPPPAAPVPEAEVAPAPEGDAGGRGIDAELKSKIKRISETELEVDRSAVDKILENQADLMKSARIVPEQKDGKVVGIRLFGVRPETLLGQLGLANGDRLESINGFDMGSPEKALEAYARLRTAGSLTIKVNRRGKPTTININIK